MPVYYGNNDYRDYLIHHGILGMKWGVRRYQNKDGSYTPAGKKRYGIKGERKPLSKNAKRAIATGAAIGTAAVIGGATAGRGGNKSEKDLADNSSDFKKWIEPSIKSGKDKPNISPAQKIGQETGKTITGIQKIAKSSKIAKSENEERKTIGKEISRMSNSELQERINRLNLEERYSTLRKSELDRGKEVSFDILDHAESIASIAGSAATIATLLYMMKKK